MNTVLAVMCFCIDMARTEKDLRRWAEEHAKVINDTLDEGAKAQLRKAYQLKMKVLKGLENGKLL